MNLVILQFFYQKIHWNAVKVIFSIRDSKNEVFTWIFFCISLLKSLDGFQNGFVNSSFALTLYLNGFLNIFF